MAEGTTVGWMPEPQKPLLKGAEMAEDTTVGWMPEPQKPLTDKTPDGDAPAAVDPAEFARVTAALKEANKEAADRRKKLEAYEKAEADRKAAEMTEAEKSAAKIKEYESKLAQLERAALLRKIADEVGLPASLAERLQGSTEEELMADAKKLLELVPKKQTLTAVTTNPGNAKREETPAEMRARLMPQNVNVFDPAWSRQHGGGVTFNDKE